jgi:hypothetical protein
MPEVKVRRTGIATEQVSAAIGDALGPGVLITPAGETGLDVRKNFFVRAKVTMHTEPGGTLFDVRGGGVPVPLLFLTMMWVNNRGIAQQIATAIGAREEFRDNG